jgi:formate dehydrogenase iron-sulfur subunit
MRSDISRPQIGRRGSVTDDLVSAPKCGTLPPRAPNMTQQPFDLLDHLLQEQRTLTAVDQFSALHDESSRPAHAKFYRDLIPSRDPQDGEQLAFQVDLDLCSGCKACVTACHSLNGLDAHESFRDVGLLIGESDLLPVVQHVTTACHHCVDPACLNACPVNAYEKDPTTGIVRHLDDQCFGCQYCTLACPYEVPRYHADKGIVRKCDMCTQRLEVGEAPACVQACPHQAISIQVISLSEARTAASAGRFLSDSPDPSISIPTTRFVGRGAESLELSGGTYHSEQLEPAHAPLILLLVLSQISVGLTTILSALQYHGSLDNSTTLRTGLLVAASVMAVASAACSTFHLGRPQYAFRAFLGFRHSWLSREIVAFGLYVPLTVAAAVASAVLPSLLPPILVIASIVGIAAVLCSAMIYQITERAWWHATRSVPAFLLGGTGISAALTAALLFLVTGQSSLTAQLSMLATCCFLMKAGYALRIALEQDAVGLPGRLAESARRVMSPLRRQWLLMLFSFTIAVFLTTTAAVTPRPAFAVLAAIAAVVFAVAAEVTERYLFFRAVVPLRMPGVCRR